MSENLKNIRFKIVHNCCKDCDDCDDNSCFMIENRVKDMNTMKTKLKKT